MRYAIYLLFLLLIHACDPPEKNRTLGDGANPSQLIHYPLPRASDSLFALLRVLPADTNRVNVLHVLAWNYKDGNPDSALILGDSAISMTEDLLAHTTDKIMLYKLKMLLATGFGNEGVYYQYKSDFLNAQDSYIKALKLDEELKDTFGIIVRNGNIGMLYWNLEDFDNALLYYGKSLARAERGKNKRIISILLGNIGNVYADQAKSKTSSAETDSLYHKASLFYQRALKLKEELGNKTGICTVLLNIGILYVYQGMSVPVKETANSHLRTAVEYLQKAMSIANELKDPQLIASCSGNLASALTSLGEYKSGCQYLYRALSLSDSIHHLDDVRGWYEKLSTLYGISDQPLPDTTGGKLLSKEQMRLRSLFFYKRSISIKDSLFSEENKKQLVRKEMNYEFDKKEAISKAENDKKAVLAKEQLAQKEKERNYFIAGFALVLLLAGFIFRGYRQKQKANAIISHQKAIVEEKQKEILDSIHYAKRIQQSLLPTEKYISKYLNRHEKG